MSSAHEQTIVGEFSHQAETFNTSAVANDGAVLDRLLALAEPRADERWLDAACGPGVVTRALAPLVREAYGLDATPAMLAVARREAAARELANVTFGLGDATASDLPSGSFDGALARFAIHHIPVPARLFDELARVVRPGGRIVLADHLADDDVEAFAFAQELERLRDPSHWLSPTQQRLRALGAQAGLRLATEQLVPFDVDFEDWLERGSGGAQARRLVERALAARPGGTERFRVTGVAGARRLELTLWLSLWER
jgi:ubiquinone/menaquinone biosynthesis C-methylase UbiE